MHLPSYLGRPSRAQRFLPPMIVTPPPSPRKTPSTTSRPGRRIRTGVPPSTRRHFRTVIAHHPHITIRHRTIEVTVDPIITIPVAVGNLTTAAVAATTEVATIPLPRSETSRPVLLLLTKVGCWRVILEGSVLEIICPISDEYTKITTPRQDVLFKKGYLSRPKKHLSATPSDNVNGSSTTTTTTTDGSDIATGSGSVSTAESVTSDSTYLTDGMFMDSYPTPYPYFGYIDQSGVLVMNGRSNTCLTRHSIRDNASRRYLERNLDTPRTRDNIISSNLQGLPLTVMAIPT